MYRNSFRLTNREIDEAFASGQIGLAYQPKLAMGTGEVVGVECFARWRHPAFGTIPPALFLPVFARQGRNEELTRFVLASAIGEAARWRGAAAGWTVSVNVSPGELADGTLPVSLRLALTARDLDPARLVVDLPEAGLADDPARAAATVHALAEIGTGLALECAPEPLLDFSATGDDGAPGLRMDAFGELKIGGTAMMRFASRIGTTGMGLMHDRLAFARRHGMATTAVGAESAHTLLSLRRLGFDRVQGNAAAPPMPGEALADFDGPATLAACFASLPAGDDKTDADADAPTPAMPTPARVRVVRGNARVALVPEDEEHAHTGRRVIRLMAPAPDEPARHGWLARLHAGMARALGRGG